MRTLGLALGGGGARGFAHVGILKVLQREGFPVSFLAGTSMGGIIACLYAMGKTVGELEELCLRLARVRELMKLVDLNPPRQGLLEGTRVQAYLAHLIGETTLFSDLSIPVCLSAVDLLTAAEVKLSTGRVLPAVMATSAFPGLLPPREYDGSLLVDGGVLNNVPADIAREMGADVVVAVDVQHNPCEEPPWQFLPKKPRWTSRMPELFLDFYRSELIMIAAMTQRRIAEGKPDLVLRPRIPPDITMFLGFTRADELIAAGEAAAEEILPELSRLLAV